MTNNNITGKGTENQNTELPHNQIVISSRIRLARNLRNLPFPGWARKNERAVILETIRSHVESIPEMESAPDTQLLQDLTALDKQVLVERHLISREHAAKGAGSAVILNQGQSLSIMINEEDHLRIQAIFSGLQLDTAFEFINKVDSGLEQVLDFAFHNQFGYLTACPTNLGTGMRASAMVHLPALVLSEQITQVVQAVNKIGLAVRGLYGEGTEAMGNLFQVSNQVTLGESEEEILARLTKVIQKIIQHEYDARKVLLQKRPVMLLDQIGRAYGVLANAYSMTSKEALSYLSFLRLGVDLDIFPEEVRLSIDELFMETQPAHLQKNSQKKLAAEKRDELRAEIIRDKLKSFPKPDINKLFTLIDSFNKGVKDAQDHDE